jgi:hypothetical protein
MNKGTQNIGKALLLLFGTISVAVAIGAIIGLTATREPSSNSNLTAAFANSESPVVSLPSIPSKSSSSELLLPTVAVVDMARVLAAEPRLEFQKKMFDERRGAIPSTSDKRARDFMSRDIEMSWSVSRKILVQEIQSNIQGIIAAYATNHNLTLVLDCSAKDTNAHPVLLYSSDGTDFSRIIGASGLKDITWYVTREMAKERSTSAAVPPEFSIPLRLPPGVSRSVYQSNALPRSISPQPTPNKN